MSRAPTIYFKFITKDPTLQKYHPTHFQTLYTMQWTKKDCESYVTWSILQCCAIIVFIWTSTLKLNYDPTSQCARVTRSIKFGPCIIDLSGFSSLLHQKQNKMQRKATIDWLSFCFNFWSAFLAVFKHVMSFITIECKRAIKR